MHLSLQGTSCMLQFKMLTRSKISLYFLCISLTHFPTISTSVHVPISSSWYRNSCSHHSPLFVLGSLSWQHQEQIQHHPSHRPRRTQSERGTATLHLKSKYLTGYQAWQAWWYWGKKKARIYLKNPEKIPVPVASTPVQVPLTPASS